MKILLIDDHRLFSKSIQMILQIDQDVEKIDVVNDLAEINYPLSNKYDMILVDINLNNLYEESGLDLAESMLKRDGLCKIIILTGYQRVMYEYRALQIGAYGFIDKSIDPSNLLVILKKINLGYRYFRKLWEPNQKIFLEEPLEIVDKLTSREIEVLSYVKSGMNVDQISQKINVSERTVFNHLNNTYSKLQVSNRQEALVKADILGYFPPS